MTLTATPRKAGPFVGTGASVAYPYGFRIETADDVRVYQDQDVVSNALYSVSGVGEELGGAVTFIAALSSRVWIFGNLPLEQQDISLVPGGAISSSGIELEADKAVQREWEVNEQLERSLLFHQSTIQRNTELPEFAGNALKFFQVNATENGVVFAAGTLQVGTPVPGVTALLTNQRTLSVDTIDNVAQLSTSGLVPAGSQLTQLMASVEIELGNSRGFVSWSLGTVSAFQRFGRGKARTVGTVTNAGEVINYVIEPAPSGLEAVITADTETGPGGPFDTIGRFVVTAVYEFYAVPLVVP